MLVFGAYDMPTTPHSNSEQSNLCPHQSVLHFLFEVSSMLSSFHADACRRMMVLTTNHPERLDPALIRPGRINKSIYMGLLEPKEALEMLR